jgi:hypothetical protein
MARTITEKQQAFMNALFDDANGDVITAKKTAAYRK